MADEIQDERVAEVDAEISKAFADRAATSEEVRKLQAQLAGADRYASGYRQWREHTINELKAKQNELTRLKGLIATLHYKRDQVRRQVRAVTRSEINCLTDLRKQTGAMFYRMCDAMKELENQVAELMAENQALRDKLGRLELDRVSAPLIDPSGEEKIDAWRDLTKT